jgi:hypothetical protein
MAPTLFARFLTAFACLLIAAAAAAAQGTHLWTQSRIDEFEKGTPDGVAITSDGRLREAPGLKEILTTPSTFVWSIAADKSGTAYVGTGAPAAVLRVAPDGKSTTLFETRDLAVQVVRLGPDGSIYAATMPSGRIYKLNPAAPAKQDQDSATVVFDLAKAQGDSAKPAEKDDDKTADKSDKGSHYIWDMTFDSSGRLYIATGGPGCVYRVDTAKAGATPELWFKSDEQHVRALAWDAKGNLIAGTDGSGLVYSIRPDGKGYVLFQAPRREIPSVAVTANGAIFAAAVGDKNRNPLPPLPVQGTGMVTITVVQPGSLQAANASASVPEGTEIYVLKEGQAPRRVWIGKDEVVYALAAHADGVIALSGNRGRIFQLHEDETYSDIAHLQAQQGLALSAPAGGRGDVLIGTGNTGKVVSLGSVQQHQYVSDVLDAGALARFGRVEIEPGSSSYQLLTRSGNVEQPVRGWSDWQPLRDGVVASPAGRFLQWKAVLNNGGTVGGVGVNYLPVNAAPQVDDVVVVPGARLNQQGQPSNQQTVNIAFPSASGGGSISFDPNSSGNPLPATKDRTAVTARWAAHDDNGDDLVYALYLRGDGEKNWRLLKDNITEKAYTFDQTTLPDGGYELKVVASDAPSHTPAEALKGEKVSERFEIDTTAPVVSNLKAAQDGAQAVHVTLDADDPVSAIARAEFSLDAGPWQYVEPVGALSDSRREHYDFTIPAADVKNKPGEHLLTVRVYDRHENVGLAKATFETAREAK